MDGLDLGFGLTTPTSHNGAGATWTNLLRALGLDPASATDEAVASRLSAAAASHADAVGHLLDELNGIDDPIAGRVSNLVGRLGATGLQPLLVRLEISARTAALQNAARSLTPAALLPLIEAAGNAYALPLSQPLLELVQKLARESVTLSAGPRMHAEQAYRSLIDHLVDRWSEAQVSAGAVGFDAMFGGTQRVRSSLAPEPSRIVALSLESGAVGTVVWASLKEYSRDESGVRAIIGMLTDAPEGRARQMITEQIASPARLTQLLREDPIDYVAVDTMIAALGSNATKTLLDELVESTSRATRRAIMDRLVKMGSEIGPLVNERLNDNRWYVVRNMISLLRECGCPLDQVPIERFKVHEDARVRRETLQLMMEDPATRDAALAAALQDKDKSVVRAALQAARTSFPPSAVVALAKRVVESDFPPEFRVMSLYLLGRSGHAPALEALLAYAGGGKNLLGKPRLANKTPEMLAALSGLARAWPTERRSRELLDLALKSKDEQILNALQSVGSGD